MIDVLALCSCACITTCLWCAVAALTSPRIANVPAHCEGPRICLQSSCPLKFHRVTNWSELGTPQIYPVSNCPDISYPIFLCPMNFPPQSFLSDSTSVQATDSAISSTSDPIPKIPRSSSRVEKNRKPSPRNIDGDSSAFDSNPEQDSIFEDADLGRSPGPPSRLRRSRNKSLKSILKSKFKRRDPDTEDRPVSRPLDKETETDFHRSQEHPTTGRGTRFHCLKELCRASRSKRSPAGSEAFKYRRCSQSASHLPPPEN